MTAAVFSTSSNKEFHPCKLSGMPGQAGETVYLCAWGSSCWQRLAVWSGDSVLTQFSVLCICFCCRILGKFAFSLSQDWELPIKREVSRWHLSFSHSARGFTYCLPLPALCFSPSSASSGASSRSCGWGCFPCWGRLCSRSCVAVLAEGAACPAQLGQRKVTGSLSSLLSKPKGLSLCQLCKGGKCRKLPWVPEASACSGCACKHNFPFSGCGALTRSLCHPAGEGEEATEGRGAGHAREAPSLQLGYRWVTPTPSWEPS